MRAEAATDDGLDRIWRTQILPLLEEFHYGDTGVDVAKRYGLSSLRAAVKPAEAAPPAAPPPDVEPPREDDEG